MRIEQIPRESEEIKSNFHFDFEVDKENRRVKVESFVFILRDGKPFATFEPPTKLTDEKYAAMIRQVAGILHDLDKAS